jgi:hypothetical protein
VCTYSVLKSLTPIARTSPLPSSVSNVFYAQWQVEGREARLVKDEQVDVVLAELDRALVEPVEGSCHSPNR